MTWGTDTVVRARFPVNFPASVEADGGLKVTKQNGIFSVEPDWETLAVTAPPTNAQLWVFDPDTGAYSRASVSDVLAVEVANATALYPSRDVAAAASIPAIVDNFFIAGYSTGGDGGAALYKRIATPSPVQAWQFQSTDGAWWGLAATQPNVKMFGAKGDNSTDDRAAFVAALAYGAGGAVYVPRGIYRSVASSPINIPTGTKLVADGPEATQIRFEAPTTSYVQFLVPQNGAQVEGINFTSTIPAGGQAVLWFINASRLRFKRCNVEGGMTYSGGWNHTLYPAQLASAGTQEDIVWQDCGVSDSSFFPLKSNTDTSTQRKLHFLNCTVNSFYGIGVNSPAGIADDILVTGCSLKYSAATAGAEESILLHFASCSNLRIVNNNLRGTARNGIHCEENSLDVIVTGNTIDMDSVIDGIRFLDNDISGVRYAPQNVIIEKNIVVKRGTQSTGIGINVALDASGVSGAKRVSVHNNHVDNFATGVAADVLPSEGFGARGNLIENCALASSLTYSVPTYAQNHHRNCTAGVTCAKSGGLLGANTFENCTTIFATASQRWAAAGWDIILATQTHAGGGATENKTLIDPGVNGLYGGELRLAVSRVGSTSDSSHKRFSPLTWDGASFTGTVAIPASEPGTLACTVARSSTSLATAVFKSGAAATDIIVSASFAGVWVVA